MLEIGNSSALTDATSDKRSTFEAAMPRRPSERVEVPDYLVDVYHWAYLNPRNAAVLDHELVVSAILWGQHRRLQRATFEDIDLGSKVFLPAHVYGQFVPNLARNVGPKGHLDVADISPVQIELCGRKTKDFPWVSVSRADARHPRGDQYDVVCCYFLLHELPNSCKREVVDALLDSVKPGGKAVFVDYHKPKWANPVKPIIWLVFHLLEPFAKSIWDHSIEEFATKLDAFSWRKEIYFGGLYQKVVATKR